MKILVTGGYGLIGSALFSLDTEHELIRFHRSDYDLVYYNCVEEMLDNYAPDMILHLAAKVGGIAANLNKSWQFYTENMFINLNILDVAKNFGIKKVISMLSTCVFSDNVTYPITEDQLHSGPPHPSNFGFAMAKRCLAVHSDCLNNGNGRFICAIPSSIFGEGDNFDLEDSHVIPAVIRKIYEAKQNGVRSVTMWGSGRPLREFTYSKDIARMLMHLLHNDVPDLINIGYAESEISIKDTVQKIAEVFDYDGEIVWDTSKPEGQFRKPSDCSKLFETGWSEEVCEGFDQGLVNTCRWFEENYPKIRGINV